MNELIKKCAQEAGITTNLDTDYFERDMNKWVDYYSEKFAELIIEECELALWSESCRVSDLAYEEYSSNCRKIQEHFKASNAAIRT
jgi:hypothetical protein